MGILNIRPVQRGGSKVIIGIAGPSGSGKTYTALKIARGMASSASKVGFLDTEHGRGSMYDNILDGKFMIGDLYPPFSPKRYSEAIKEFQDAGVEVLVVDSVSHEWEGEGGCDDIASNTSSKVANWRLGKSEHKKFMNALLHCNMHIVASIRAREKTDFKDITKPVSLGMQPVCEKNFMFELTASIMISNEGKKQTALKIPAFLKKAFGDGNDYLGEATGKAILEWVNTGEQEDENITKLKSELLMATEGGLAKLGEVWNKISQADKKILQDFKETCKTSAMAYDEINKENNDGANSPADVQTKRILAAISNITSSYNPHDKEAIKKMCEGNPELEKAFEVKMVAIESTPRPA